MTKPLPTNTSEASAASPRTRSARLTESSCFSTTPIEAEVLTLPRRSTRPRSFWIRIADPASCCHDTEKQPIQVPGIRTLHPPHSQRVSLTKKKEQSTTGVPTWLYHPRVYNVHYLFP
jgi:hypothetical protein